MSIWMARYYRFKLITLVVEYELNIIIVKSNFSQNVMLNDTVTKA